MGLVWEEEGEKLAKFCLTDQLVHLVTGESEIIVNLIKYDSGACLS